VHFETYKMKPVCNEFSKDKHTSYYVTIPSIEHDIMDILFAIVENLIDCFGENMEIYTRKSLDLKSYIIAIRPSKQCYLHDVITCISQCADVLNSPNKWSVEPAVIFGMFDQKIVISHGIICD
jgi:hypothetical protein